jgi:carbohydrate kinase (thermoresistant glucokinase family)
MRQALVVMGPAGSGKSLIGSALAAALHLPFIEGDNFHPPANVALMAAGTPLTDDDRHEWLLALADQLGTARTDARGVVLSCSALKRRYRDLLRSGDDATCFVFLSTDVGVLRERLLARRGHYMPATLLDSQLAALESPGDDECAMTIDAHQAPAVIVATVLERLPAMFRITE